MPVVYEPNRKKRKGSAGRSFAARRKANDDDGACGECRKHCEELQALKNAHIKELQDIKEQHKNEMAAIRAKLEQLSNHTVELEGRLTRIEEVRTEEQRKTMATKTTAMAAGFLVSHPTHTLPPVPQVELNEVQGLDPRRVAQVVASVEAMLHKQQKLEPSEAEKQDKLQTLLHGVTLENVDKLTAQKAKEILRLVGRKIPAQKGDRIQRVKEYLATQKCSTLGKTT